MSETVLTEQERITLNVLGDGCANHKAQMQAARIIDRLDAELVRLTNALPKTADGKVVVPGMEVWFIAGNGWVSNGVARFVTTECIGNPGSGGGGTSGVVFWQSAATAYSTREAALAEAAKGGQ